MLICRNAEWVHGQRKVENPWFRRFQAAVISKLHQLKINQRDIFVCSPFRKRLVKVLRAWKAVGT